MSATGRARKALAQKNLPPAIVSGIAELVRATSEAGQCGYSGNLFISLMLEFIIDNCG